MWYWNSLAKLSESLLLHHWPLRPVRYCTVTIIWRLVTVKFMIFDNFYRYLRRLVIFMKSIFVPSSDQFHATDNKILIMIYYYALVTLGTGPELPIPQFSDNFSYILNAVCLGTPLTRYTNVLRNISSCYIFSPAVKVFSIITLRSELIVEIM